MLGVDPGSPTRAWRERIGLVLQECELDPTLTVRETLPLFAGFYPHAAAGRRDDRARRAGRAGATRAWGRSRAASGGALDVARRARSATPTSLFLDEPTTGFDPSARRDAWNMIEGLQGAREDGLPHHPLHGRGAAPGRPGGDPARRRRSSRIGRPDELGAGRGRGTAIVSFRLPARRDAGRDAPPGSSGRLEASGGVASPPDGQPAADALPAHRWAERARTSIARGPRGAPAQPGGHLPRADRAAGRGGAAWVTSRSSSRQTALRAARAPSRNPRVIVFGVVFPSSSCWSCSTRSSRRSGNDDQRSAAARSTPTPTSPPA